MWSNSTFNSILSNKTRGKPLPSSSMTATSRLSICSTTSTRGIGVQSEGLLAVIPILALIIIFASVVIFLLMRLRKLRQRQDQSTRLKLLIRREPSNVVSPTLDAFPPEPAFSEPETSRLPTPVPGRFYERFSHQ